MTRLVKSLGLILIALLFTQYARSNSEPDIYSQNWQAYKKHYVDEGRVIDTGNGNISHSEGQGYGMLFAVYADDSEQFEAMWAWTKNILERDDNLFSWKYVPCSDQNSNCIEDTNNATDGDILIAWALIVAAERWNKPEYQTQALTIINSIESKLVKNRYGYDLLLPGAYGFENDDQSIQINLSYWVFPALVKFQQITNNPIWQSVIESGEALILKAQFGRWKLTPDWLIIADDGVSIENAISQDYAYNACRVPIYLVLAGNNDPELLDPYLSFWQQANVPGTVNLLDGSVADYNYNSGMQAVAKATTALVEHSESLSIELITAETDYYSSSLIMLSHLALLLE